jgi:dipeptidyl aminopeptidase/acylaminoacyl peptidase
MWTPDGHIVFLADARGESYLCAVPVHGGEVRRIAGGGMQLSAAAFDSTARRAAMVATTPASPGDIALIETATGTQRKLTSYNRAYLDQYSPARLEKSAISRDGMEIESRVWLPPDFDASESYPMVLDIHGGPHGVFADAFSPIQQVLATAGYVVLAVNPRGSSTYGVDFVKAVLGDWGGEDYLDIMAAVDDVTARPYVDSERLGVTGYSYGGYMSSWIVGHDHRFRAAVVGAPCTDLYSMYGTSDIGVWFGELNWHARPWESADLAMERSPITYAPNVETPVLLMHGEDDHRCPIGQSEEYFAALQRLGKEVEFVRFPGSSHMFLRGGHPRLREEYLSRTLAWFDKHLGRDR